MKIVFWIALASLIFVVWVQAAHPIANSDFGWHVAMGRWILEHGSVPDSEPFTHTAYGAPMVAYAWLSQVTYAAVLDAAGVVGLRWANAALACLSVGFLFVWLRRSGCGAGVALLGCVVWSVLIEGRLQMRPHMWSVLLFVVAYGALFVVRPRLGRAQIAGFFGVAVLWINLHSAALLLPAILLLYAAVATFERHGLGRSATREGLGEGRLSRLWILAGMATFAIVVSPNHVGIFGYVLESGRVNADLSLEWASVASVRGLTGVSPLWIVGFYGLVVTTGIVAVIRRRQVELSELAVVLFVTALPFVSLRFSWTCFVPLLFVLSQWKTPKRVDLAAGVVAAAAVLVLAVDLDPSQLRGRLGVSSNFRPAVFPVGAMTFLEKANLEGNLFASNKWGGYVLFRTQERYPVFIDGRWVTIGEHVVRDSHAIANRTKDYEKLLDDYEIEILLVPRGWLTDAIRSGAGWIPVFENFNSGIYLRAGRQLGNNLERCERYYEQRQIPFDSQAGFVERTAAESNPRWARNHRVQRRHLHQFRSHGIRGALVPAHWVESW